MFKQISINEINELLGKLVDPYLITDGVNILDKNLDIAQIDNLSISSGDEDMIIKKENGLDRKSVV